MLSEKEFEELMVKIEEGKATEEEIKQVMLYHETKLREAHDRLIQEPPNIDQ